MPFLQLTVHRQILRMSLFFFRVDNYKRIGRNVTNICNYYDSNFLLEVALEKGIRPSLIAAADD